MLTNNCKKLMSQYLMKNWYSTATYINGLINTNNVTANLDQSASANLTTLANAFNSITTDNSMSALSSDGAISCLALGSGTTEATTSDYKLESIISNANLVVSSATVGATTNGKQYSVVVSNATNEDITVSEIGLFLKINLSAIGMGGGVAGAYMLARDVLETPAILTPGQVGTFTFEINFI